MKRRKMFNFLLVLLEGVNVFSVEKSKICFAANKKGLEKLSRAENCI